MHLQIHLLDSKRQLETEMNLHMNTKELLKNSQKETAALKQVLHNLEAQLASQSSERIPGQGKKRRLNNHPFRHTMFWYTRPNMCAEMGGASSVFVKINRVTYRGWHASSSKVNPHH